MSPKRKAMLERIARLDGRCQFIQVSGDPPTLQWLLANDYIEMSNHPSVVDRAGKPVDAVRVTDKGRAEI